MPGSPAASRKDAMEAARPTLIVTISDLMCFMVSNSASPAMTLPPGELMYR